MNTQFGPIYTGNLDHDDALDEASEASDTRIKAITLDRVAHATDQQRLDAVGTMLGMADPDDLATTIDNILFSDLLGLAGLRAKVRAQLYSDLEPDVIREVYREIAERRAHGAITED